MPRTDSRTRIYDPRTRDVHQIAFKGAKLICKELISVTALTGATVTATGLIPTKFFCLGVFVRVMAAITGASAFTIGDGTDVDRWGTAIALAEGTVTSMASFTAVTSSGFFAITATDVVLTATTSDFTGGTARISVLGYDGTADARRG